MHAEIFQCIIAAGPNVASVQPFVWPRQEHVSATFSLWAFGRRSQLQYQLHDALLGVYFSSRTLGARPKQKTL